MKPRCRRGASSRHARGCWVHFAISIVAAAGVVACWLPGQLPKVNGYDGVVIAIGAIASMPVQIAVLAFAAQLRRWKPADYLAINIPRRSEIVFAVVCVIVLDLLFDAMLYVPAAISFQSFQIRGLSDGQGCRLAAAG